MNQQIVDALRAGAEALHGDTLTESEVVKMVAVFENSSGSVRERARRAIKSAVIWDDSPFDFAYIDAKVRELEVLLSK